MLEISLPDWFFWLNFKEKWLTTRWAAYNKNNNEKACQAEHLKFSEQWMQTGVQSGCHNDTRVLKHPVWRGSYGIILCSKSCYFSDVKTPLFPFILLLPKSDLNMATQSVFFGAFYMLPLCLELFPFQCPPWSGWVLLVLKPQVGWTCPPPRNLPWLSCSGWGAYFKRNLCFLLIQHLLLCTGTACVFAGLLPDRAHAGYYCVYPQCVGPVHNRCPVYI